MKEFLAAWCIVLGFAFIWPQVWRAVRHDTSHGISPFGLLHGLVGSSLWWSYGILQHDVAVWLSNTNFLIAQSIIISVTYRHGKIPRLILIRIGALVPIVMLAFTHIPSSTVGVVAIVVSGSSIFPQLIHVIKTDNLHGLSIASLALSAVNCASWMIYGFVANDHMVSFQNFVTVPVFLYMIYKAWAWRAANNVPIFGQAK
jgi:uncharacterized protein with PQ loop repeat